MQTTAQLLMIRPAAFTFNEQTAVNNAFQTPDTIASQSKALTEFENMVAMLRAHDIQVEVVTDTATPHTPDSIFPNNWLSTHEDGTVCLYPMFAPNRRLERKPEVLKLLSEHFTVTRTLDFTQYEQQQLFLEGTGSMVLDRENRLVYACLSDRTHPMVLADFCRQMNYQPVLFKAADLDGQAIYHTNVMMALADRYAVICLESITDAAERTRVQHTLEQTGKTIIPITLQQLYHFAGNMLQVKNTQGQSFLVLSQQAIDSLTPIQKAQLELFNPLLSTVLDTIETNGGGSARCMMAEIFLPKAHSAVPS